MKYTQTGFTGRTGARPITALARQITRDLAARVESAGDVERNALYPILEGSKRANGLSSEPLWRTLSFCAHVTGGGRIA